MPYKSLDLEANKMTAMILVALVYKNFRDEIREIQITFTANGNRQIQVDDFSKKEMNK